MAREFLWLVKESAFGVPMTAPVAGVDSLYIRLDEGNAFTVRPQPKIWEIAHGGGFAVNALSGSDMTAVSGTLKTKLYASQALFLFGWGLTRINSAQTSPWATTEPAGDLCSVSAFHAIQRADGSYKRRQYPGGKVAKGALAISRESQIGTINFDLVFQKALGNTFDASVDPTATAFPAPTEAQYPTDPYQFIHAAGGLTIGGTTRTLFGELNFEWQNALSGKAYESRWLQYLRCLGRKTTLAVKDLYVATPDDRSVYELVTAESATLALNNGTHTTTFGFSGNNVLGKVDDDLPLADIYEQGFTLNNQWDPAANSGAGADVAFTFA